MRLSSYPNPILVVLLLGNATCCLARSARTQPASAPTSFSFPYVVPAGLGKSPINVQIDIARTSRLNAQILGFNAQLLQSPFSYSDPQLDKLVGELRPVHLRFPGGTVANFYDWRTDTFPYAGSDSPAWTAAGAKRLEAKGKYGYSGYVSLCKKYGIEPVLVANMGYQKPEGIVTWLDQMGRDGLAPRYVELGNEMYLRSHNPPEIKTVGEYLQVAERFAAAIKKAHPEVKVAVCAGPFRSAKWREWNKAVASGTFYDGVVYHAYTGGPIQSVMAGDVTMHQTSARCKSNFGDRPIWLTEWNVGPRAYAHYDGTGAHAMYVASAVFGLLSHPDVFEIACYHQLVQHFGILAIEDGKPVRSPDFPAWQLLLQSCRGMTELAASRVGLPRPTGWSFDPVAARALAAKDGSLRLLLLNRLPVAVDVVVESSGKVVQAATVSQCTYPSVGRVTTPEITKQEKPRGIRLAPFTLAAVDLPRQGSAAPANRGEGGFGLHCLE